MPVSKKSFENQVLDLLARLEGVARRLTRNDADAEDLVAETVARAWRALDTLEHEAAFRGWIFRILNNAFLDDCRRRGARPQTESLDCEEVDEDEAQRTYELLREMDQLAELDSPQRDSPSNPRANGATP